MTPVPQLIRQRRYLDHFTDDTFLDLRVTYVCKEGEIGATVYLVPGLRANSTVLRGLREDKEVQGGHTAGEQKIARDYKLSVKQNFTVRVTQQPGTS